VNRVVLGAQAIALTAILVTGRILLAHSRPRPKYAELMSRLPGRPRMQLRMPERPQMPARLQKLAH
jgi:hypothetical protein